MSGLFLALPAVVFYCWGAIRQWQHLIGRKPANRGAVLLTAMTGALLHLGYIIINNFAYEHINFELFEVASISGWVMVLLLIFSCQRKPMENLFIGLLPINSVILLIAAFNHSYVPLSDLSYGLTWHILLSILAYSVLIIAALQSILLYWQDKALKQRKALKILQSLPPLLLMDRLLFELIWLGMLLLTASYIVGWPYIFSFKEQHLSHKVIFALISWLVFAWLLFGRYRFGWRGVVASRWTLIGTGFMLLSYFGSKFVLEIILGRI